jgi:uncharacterized repeat protein (TIGR02543 family)
MKLGNNVRSFNMKKMAVIGVLVSLALIACFSPWKGEEGTLTINLGGGNSRVIVPWLGENYELTYVFNLDGGPGGPHVREIPPPGGTVVFSTAPGDWNISVEAYEINEDGGTLHRHLIAVGRGSVTIKPGQNSAVTITLGKPPNEGPPPIPPSIFKVTFNSNGGTDIEDQFVTEGGTVKEPAAPTKPGYKFTGWYKDTPLSILWNFNTETVSADVTIYAKWIPDQVFSLSVEQIIDGAPILDNITIYRTSGRTSATLTVNNPAQYSNIEWRYNNILLSSEASLTLTSSDTRYNMLGPKLLTLEVIKDSIPYSRTITFTVEE